MSAVKLAMWSGPRNLSTAMMYAFGNRVDFDAVDEPFYAAYLAKTGLQHPMQDAVLDAQSHDPNEVISTLIQPKSDKQHHYQKHQTQHMVEGFDRFWMQDVTNVFLIRHPARVLASYSIKRAHPTLEDIGFKQQVELYEMLQGMGKQPVVVDAYDIRASPESMLQKLCVAIDLEFDPAMLSWPKGPKPFDGVWALHWYGSAHQSTGFAPIEDALPHVDKDQWDILDQALECYDRMSCDKIRL